MIAENAAKGGDSYRLTAIITNDEKQHSLNFILNSNEKTLITNQTSEVRSTMESTLFWYSTGLNIYGGTHGDSPNAPNEVGRKDEMLEHEYFGDYKVNKIPQDVWVSSYWNYEEALLTAAGVFVAPHTDGPGDWRRIRKVVIYYDKDCIHAIWF